MDKDLKSNQKSYENEEAKEVYTRNFKLWDSEKYYIEKCFPLKGKILDIGVGGGRTTINLLNMGYEVYGVDISESLLKETERNIKLKCKKDVNYKLINGDISNLEFENNFFDGIVFSYNGIDYIQSKLKRKEFLSKSYSWLKKDRHLIYTTHNKHWIHWKRLWLNIVWALKGYKIKKNEIEKGYKVEKHKFGELVTHYTDLKKESKLLKEIGFKIKVIKRKKYLDFDNIEYNVNINNLNYINDSYPFFICKK